MMLPESWHAFGWGGAPSVPVTIPATSSFSVALSKSSAFSRTLAVGSAFTALLGKIADRARTIAATSALAVSLARQAAFGRTLAVGSAFVSVVGKSAAFQRIIAAAATLTAAMARVKGFVKTIAVEGGAWTKAFNFRANIGDATDGTDETYVTVGANAYPQTRNGVTFGFTSGPANQLSTNQVGLDRRLVGQAYNNNSGTPNLFRVDLPQSGAFKIGLAMGHAVTSYPSMYVQVRDDTIARIIVGPWNNPIDHWMDAEGTDLTDVTWPTDNQKVQATFDTTILVARIGTLTAQTAFSSLAHLYISQVSWTPAISHVRTLLRAIPVSSAFTVGFEKVAGAINRMIDVSSTFAASVTRIADRARAIAATSSFAPVVSKLAARARAIAIASGFTVVLQRGIGRAINVSSAFAAGLLALRTAQRAIPVASTFAAALARSSAFLQAIVASSPFTVGFDKQSFINYFQTVAATSGFTAAIARVRGYVRAVAATSAMSVALTRSRALLRTVAVTSPFAVLVRRAIGKRIDVVSVFNAAVSTFAVRARLIAVASLFGVTLVKNAVRARLIEVTTTLVPEVVRLRALNLYINVVSPFIAIVLQYTSEPIGRITAFFIKLGARFSVDSRGGVKHDVRSEGASKIDVDLK